MAADQPGGVNGTTVYGAAPQVTQSFPVAGLTAAAQTLVFDAAPAGVVAGVPAGGAGAVNGTLSAVATSGLAVNFTSLTPIVCTVSGNTVIGVSAGNCTIAADQPGGVSGSFAYGAAPQVTQSFAVAGIAAAAQTIAFGDAPVGVTAPSSAGAGNGTNGTVTATVSSGLGVTFTSLTPSVCLVSGGTVIGVAAGTCTVAANQPGGVAGTSVFGAAPQVTQSFESCRPPSLPLELG